MTPTALKTKVLTYVAVDRLTKPQSLIRLLKPVINHTQSTT